MPGTAPRRHKQSAKHQPDAAEPPQGTLWVLAVFMFGLASIRGKPAPQHVLAGICVAAGLGAITADGIDTGQVCCSARRSYTRGLVRAGDSNPHGLCPTDINRNVLILNVYMNRKR